MSKHNLNETHFGLRYIATGEQTDGQYFQCTTSIPAGDPGPPKHRHKNESEGFYVLSGSLCLIVEGREHVLNSGDFFNVAPGTTHTWSNKSAEEAELVITFSPSGIENMFRELDNEKADYELIGAKYGMTIVA